MEMYANVCEHNLRLILSQMILRADRGTGGRLVLLCHSVPPVLFTLIFSIFES